MQGLKLNIRSRAAAAAVHLAVTLAIAVVAAFVVFVIWYPYPYREISGGKELFLIVIAVDVIIGPLLTLAVFNRQKSADELRRDLAFIGFLQAMALCYGVWTVFVARPVFLVFELDAFRVVHALEVRNEELHRFGGEKRLPLNGPALLSLRSFTSEKERLEMTLTAFEGVPLAARPALWQAYENAKADIKRTAKPLDDLRSRFPEHGHMIDLALKSGNFSDRLVGFIPLAGRAQFWTVLIDLDSSGVIGFLPIDSF